MMVSLVSIRSFACLCVAVLVGATFVAMLMSSMTSAGPLKLQFSFKAPYPSKDLAWSPDNRFIALAQDKTYKVLLLNADTRAVIDGSIKWKAYPLPTLYWAVDSKSLAVIGYDVALVSAADGREIKRTTIPLDQCDNRFGRRAASASTVGLWLSCGTIRQREAYTAVYGLSLPELLPKESVKGEVPKIGYTNTIFASRIERFSDISLLATVFDSCVPGNQYGALGCDQYASCIILELQTACFKPFLLDSDGTDREPVDISLLPRQSIAVSQWRPRETSRDGLFDFAFEVHSFDGKRLSRLGFHTDRRGLDVRDFLVTSDGLLIAALAYEPKDKGGIAVWDINSGKLLQFITTPPAAIVRLSCDGARLAVVSEDEIRVFLVTGI